MSRNTVRSYAAPGRSGRSLGRITAGLILAAFAGSSVALAQTTWTAGSTVTLNSTFTVTDVLTIEPGVTVRMATNSYFIVGPTGTLVVEGTEENPVLFTAQSGSWLGVRFEPGSNGEVTGAIVERFAQFGIDIANASPVIQRTVINQPSSTPVNATRSGIRVVGADADPVILHCRIEGIRGAQGSNGSPGLNGSSGLPGANGTLLSPNGSNGGAGSSGWAGGTGGAGFSAFGVHVLEGASAILGYNTIRDIEGGRGGNGGNGGTGGSGGRGGSGFDGLASGGDGGHGGFPGSAGAGGLGGAGGRAEAIRIESSTEEIYAFQNLIFGIESGQGGTGGRRGMGGRGGDGGSGGDCSAPFCTAGDGGNGRNGASASFSGGHGGVGGAVAAIATWNNAQPVRFLSNTVGQMLAGAPGGGGLGGSGGSGGNGGLRGNAPASGTDGSNGFNGSTGSSSQMGSSGSPGVKSGVFASGADAQLEMFNSIISLGGSGWILRSESGAVITADYNNFFNFGSLASGSTVVGTNNILTDPMFVNEQSGNLRLTAMSPAVNAGSNALLPADFLDLNDNADTTEPIPFDLDGNPRISALVPGGAGLVDMGAFEGAFETEIFRREAGAWANAAPSEAYAFDEFLPGVPSGGGCLADDASLPLVLELNGGTLTVSAFQGMTPVCPVTDASGTPAVSDANLDNAGGDGRVVFEFDPPVTGFYTYFGSLAAGRTVTMDLFTDDGAGLEFLQSITSAPSPSAAQATGLGFRSATQVRRIEFTTTEMGQVLVGAFVGLVAGEQSLGTVEIEGYAGPDGATVEFDFACEFVAPPPCAPDINGDGEINFTDLNSVLSAFGESGQDLPADINDDGVVNFTDLNAVLTAFGSDCPS